MSNLIPFANDEFELTIEPHEVDGFHVRAPGLASALGFAAAKDMLRSIPDDEKGWETAPTLGGDQRIGYLTEAGFYRALGQRQTARITDPEVRAAVERFQTWVYHDVLPQIRTRGGYINPNATAAQLDNLAAQAKVLSALRGIVDSGWLDAKGRIVAARALGETPELNPDTKPLTVSTYLEGKGLTRSEFGSTVGPFGKRLKGLYVAEYGENPHEIEDVVGRHTVNVAQYQEQHRPLFDRVWTDYYARPA